LQQCFIVALLNAGRGHNIHISKMVSDMACINENQQALPVTHRSEMSIYLQTAEHNTLWSIHKPDSYLIKDSSVI